ncbi:MAG: MoaD/ThiS family protein [Balneolaceae bacterium]|nr:MAG: MoaD/ThiS family protein [Balneolaceae bacterium]
MHLEGSDMNSTVKTNSDKGLMELNVRWFSVLAEKRGTRSETVLVKPGTTGGELIESLSKNFEMLANYKNHVRLAVNRVYAEPEMVLHHGDEIAFITPVSGG